MQVLTIQTQSGIKCSGCNAPIIKAAAKTKNGRLCLLYQCPECKKTYKQTVTLGQQVITALPQKRASQQTKVFTKVSGVTFQNPDGTQRQDILRHVATGDELTIEEGTLQNRPVLILRHKLGVIGTLKTDAVQEFRTMYPDAEIVVNVVRVTGGEGEKPVFGCNILLSPKLNENGEAPAPRPNIIYVGPDGDIFHVEKHCSGILNPRSVNIAKDKSELKGAKACKRCAAKLFPEYA